MIQHDPVFIAPPPTEVPEYVFSSRYGRASWLPGRPSKRPKDIGRRVSHPSVEAALQAAKRACRGKQGRWFGRDSASNKNAVFLVYEDGKVIERHMVSP